VRGEACHAIGNAEGDAVAVRVGAILAIALAALLVMPLATAHAATFEVKNTNDSGAESLRAAVEGANADPAGAPHVIDATAVAGTINLLTQLPGLTEDVTIMGPGADQLTVRRAATAALDFRVLQVGPSTAVEITGLTIAQGRSNSTINGGGGIYNDRGDVTIRASVIRDNVNAGGSNGANGGGIDNDGTMTIIDSVISGNVANGSGGGIDSTASGSDLTVVNSTLSGNRTLGGAGCTGGGAIQNSRSLVVVNSTLSGNDGRRSGGGINTCSSSSTSVLIVNSTIASNRAAAGGANLSVDREGATGALRSTILAYPRGGGDNCFVDDPPATLTSSGYNLADDDSCALSHATDQPPGIDPLLAPLADNGGPGQTRALLPGSPAIDQGTAATGIAEFGTLTTDQRGLARPVAFGSIPNAPGGDGSDIGAMELQSLPPLPPPPPPDPPDTEVAIQIIGKKLKLNRKGVARARLACPETEVSGPCAGRLVLETRGKVRFKGKRRKVTLAKARFSIAAGEIVQVRLRLAKAKLRLLQADRRARRARGVANVRDQAGNSGQELKPLKLVPPKRKKRG
jgi:hypothetical protein